MDVLSVVVGCGALLAGAGGVGSFAYWRDTHSSRRKKDRQEEIDLRIGAMCVPVKEDLKNIHSVLEELPVRRAIELKAALHEALEPIRHSLAELATKVEPLWQALVAGAIHNAEVLHHPDPERAELDGLIDHFKANTLTSDEELLFRRYLNAIKNWEPGQDVGFPVYDSEPSAAANLLSMLELVRIYRERGRS